MHPPNGNILSPATDAGTEQGHMNTLSVEFTLEMGFSQLSCPA